MEQFALRKVTEAEKKKAKKTERTPAPPLSPEKQDELNKLFGYPNPPNIVYALGRDSSAAVWWNYEDDTDIVDWEVHRYRKEMKGGIWQHKGVITVKFLKKIKQVIFDGLTNGREYRFTVKARNASGFSKESQLSNPVLVEPSLPFGWKRRFDASLDRHVYSNSHSKQISLTRPDEDPYFLDEAVAVMFHPRETHNLRNLYDEEILHFDRVTLERFIEIMMELGEDMSRRDMVYLFRGYVDNDIEVTSYQSFMDIIAHIKKDKMKQRYLDAAALFEDKKKEKKLPKKTAAQLDRVVGAWILRYSVIAEKWYYVHTEKDGRGLWCMPDEVKYHTTAAQWDRIHNHFDFGMVERIKQQFDEVNSSRSGSISPDEFNIFLECILDVELDQVSRLLHFRLVDEGRSGAIEYGEFAEMMCKVAKRKPQPGIIGKLQLSGIIHEIAADGVIRMERPAAGPLYRGKSGIGLPDTEDDVDDTEDVNDETDGSFQFESDRPSSIEKRGILSKLFCCVRSVKVGDWGQQMFTSLQKPVGPHGRYCMCGCRNMKDV